MICNDVLGSTVCARAAPFSGVADEPALSLAFSSGSFDPTAVENVVAGATVAAVRYGPAIWNGLRIGVMAVATAEFTVPVLVGVGVGALAVSAYEWVTSGEHADEAASAPTVQLPANPAGHPGPPPGLPAVPKGVLPLKPLAQTGAQASADDGAATKEHAATNEPANDTIAQETPLSSSADKAPGERPVKPPLPRKHERVFLDLEVELNDGAQKLAMQAVVQGFGAHTMDVMFSIKGALQPSEWRELIGLPGRSKELSGDGETPERVVDCKSPAVVGIRVSFPPGPPPADVHSLLGSLLRTKWSVVSHT